MPIELTPVDTPGSPLTYVTIGGANTYFASRLHANTLWNSTTLSNKEAALKTAENDLADYYTLSASTEKHLRAIFEQAYFRLLDRDMDRRLALIAQGVTSAGIVKESYAKQVSSVVISPMARALLGVPNMDKPQAGYLTRDPDLDDE